MLAHRKTRYQGMKILSVGLSLVVAANKSYLTFFSSIPCLQIGEFGTETPRVVHPGSRRTKTVFGELFAR